MKLSPIINKLNATKENMNDIQNDSSLLNNDFKLNMSKLNELETIGPAPNNSEPKNNKNSEIKPDKRKSDPYDADKFNPIAISDVFLEDELLDLSFDLPSEALQAYFDHAKSIDQEIVHLEAKLLFLTKQLRYIRKKNLIEINTLTEYVEKASKKFSKYKNASKEKNFAFLKGLNFVKTKMKNVRKNILVKKNL